VTALSTVDGAVVKYMNKLDCLIDFRAAKNVESGGGEVNGLVGDNKATLIAPSTYV